MNLLHSLACMDVSRCDAQLQQIASTLPCLSADNAQDENNLFLFTREKCTTSPCVDNVYISFRWNGGLTDAFTAHPLGLQ